jgi:enoyl-[acyl-carrier-protein] reductase (NADH)
VKSDLAALKFVPVQWILHIAIANSIDVEIHVAPAFAEVGASTMLVSWSRRMTTQSKLAAAAEVLIEAASLESDAMTQKQLANHLDSLKSSLDCNLNMVVQKIQS